MLPGPEINKLPISYPCSPRQICQIYHSLRRFTYSDISQTLFLYHLNKINIISILILQMKKFKKLNCPIINKPTFKWMQSLDGYVIILF